MNFDLIIVGGGLAGASLAVALQASRLRVAVVEERPPVFTDAWDSRVYAISPASCAFLGEIGVWPHLDASRIAPVHDMLIKGDAGGTLQFSAYDSGLAELAWIVESGRIHRELWERLRRQHNVTMFCGVAPTELSVGDGSACVQLSDGRRLDARLVVGADGVNSWVRRSAGIGARIEPYDEMAVVANFRGEHSHRDTAFQWFRPDGVLALLPLPGRMVSMVWSCREAQARVLMGEDPASLCARVAAAAEAVVGALELETAAASFPLRMMRVDTVVSPRVALVGDAAHAIHPLSGHGVNLGFQDVRVLAEVLNALPQWRDPGEVSALRSYARARAEEPFVLQHATHALNRLFGTSNPFLSVLRNAGLNLTGKMPVVRNTLVRYAVSGRF